MDTDTHDTPAPKSGGKKAGTIKVMDQIRKWLKRKEGRVEGGEKIINY